MAPSDQQSLGEPSPLREAELADADVLVREAGWNQTADDWRAFLALGTVYGVRTAGGRVMTVVATAPAFPVAIARAYEAASKIKFAGIQYRGDIGRKALKID